MAEKREVSRRSSGTTLVWGQIEAPVSLFKMTAAVPEAKFDTEKVEEPSTDIPVTAAGIESAPSSVGEPLARESTLQQSAELAKSLGLSVSSGASPAREEPSKPPKPRKGIYREDGTFMDLTDRLEAITAATQLEEMKVIRFVPSVSVPRVLVRDAYYVGMDGKPAAKALRALEVGMARFNVVALVKWTKSTRQALGVLLATKSRGLVALQLAWPEELLEPSPRVLQHRQVILTEREQELSVELVHAMMSGPAVVMEQVDDAVTMRKQLRAAAEEGLLDAWEAPSPPARPEVESFLAALQESVSAAEPDAE
jgi:non-homologous end joining protein Ku